MMKTSLMDTCLCVSLYRKPSVVEIGGIVVNESHRGKGIDKMLLQQVMDWTIEQKNSSHWVKSQHKRLAAHQFQSIGFEETEEQKFFG